MSLMVEAKLLRGELAIPPLLAPGPLSSLTR
jgi:hypothetical protein